MPSEGSFVYPRCTEPSPRRIVLLDENGAVERVLAELPAAQVHGELRKHAEWHPGRVVGAEWQKGTDWIRWLTIRIGTGT